MGRGGLLHVPGSAVSDRSDVLLCRVRSGTFAPHTSHRRLHWRNVAFCTQLILAEEVSALVSWTRERMVPLLSTG